MKRFDKVLFRLLRAVPALVTVALLSAPLFVYLSGLPKLITLVVAEAINVAIILVALFKRDSCKP